MESAGGDVEATPFLSFFSALSYGIASMAMVFINKAILMQYAYSMTLLTFQQVATALLIHFGRVFGYTKFKGVNLSTAKKLLPVSIFYNANVAFALASLKGVNIPMYIALKRLTPLAVLVAGFCSGKGRPSTQEKPGTLPIFIFNSLVDTFYEWKFVGYSCLLGSRSQCVKETWPTTRSWALFLLSIVIPINLSNNYILPIGPIRWPLTCLEHIRICIQVSLSVIFVAVGVIIAALGDFSFDLFGYSMALTSVFFQTMYLVLVEKSGAEDGLSSVELMFYNSLLSVPFLIFLIIATGEFPHSLYLLFEKSDSLAFPVILILSLVMGIVLNFTMFLCTIVNSALTTTIVGVLKGVGSTTLGFVLLGGVQVHALNVTGLVINTAGGVWYSYAKYRQKKVKQRKAPSDAESRDK